MNNLECSILPWIIYFTGTLSVDLNSKAYRPHLSLSYFLTKKDYRGIYPAKSSRVYSKVRGQSLVLHPPQPGRTGTECLTGARLTLAHDSISDQMDRACNAPYRVMTPLVMWLITVHARCLVRPQQVHATWTTLKGTIGYLFGLSSILT